MIALILLLVGYWRRASVWWGRTFVLTAGLIVGGVIGWFEGGYNHVLKDALYASGVDHGLLSRMYPAPFYVPPGNVVFEVTGVLQWGSASSSPPWPRCCGRGPFALRGRTERAEPLRWAGTSRAPDRGIVSPAVTPPRVGGAHRIESAAAGIGVRGSTAR